jgi:hypothetical protein
VSFQLSDVLGEHNLAAILQMNGRFEDFGGVVGYENRKHRWTWGAQISQIPYVTGSFSTGQDQSGAIIEQSELFRETDRALQTYIAYPFSRASRFELAAAARHISFGREIETLAFDPFSGQLLAQDRQKLDAPSGIGSAREVPRSCTTPRSSERPVPSWASATGSRSRRPSAPEVHGRPGRLSPVRDAHPAHHPGRTRHPLRALRQRRQRSRITPLFIGYPTLMRGYDVNSFSASECGPDSGRSCPVFDQLVGSRIAVANLELRIPLLGLFNRRNLYGPIPIELIGFSDWGVAWTAEDRARVLGGDGTRSVVKSYGGGARINLLGFAVVEVDMVKAVDRPQKGWSWIFNFMPGF